MSVFSARITHRSFHFQISALCFVLGVLLAAASFTASRGSRAGFTRPGFVSSSSYQAPSENEKEMQSEIKKLQSEIASLRKKDQEKDNLLASSSDTEKRVKALNQELNEIKLFAGLSDAVGPGIQVTLVDSNKKPAFLSDQSKLNSLIHDSDIANVINELKGAGAEAITVNGQRIVAVSTIRCVGPVIQVNSVPAAPPYIIQAIGNPDTLSAALNLQHGVLDEFRMFDPGMVKLEKKKKLHLSAFAGSTQMRSAHAAAK